MDGRSAEGPRSASQTRHPVPGALEFHVEAGARRGNRSRGVPEPKDARFQDPEWSQNPVFDFLKQAYLITSRWAEDVVEGADQVDETTKQKARFYLKQLSSALSPSNFLLTNPELIRETIQHNGANLVRGIAMLAEDIEAGGGELRIRQSDPSFFKVGHEHRDDARQGDLPQRSDGADPVHADDGEGAEASAADRAALDQQVLHSRPQPGKELRPLGRLAGADGVLHLMGQPARATCREELRALHARGHFRGAGCDRRQHRREEGHGDRLLRRRHAAGDGSGLHGGETRQAHRERNLLHGAGGFHLFGRPEGLRRRGADRRHREGHEEAGLSRMAATWRTPSTCCARTT